MLRSLMEIFRPFGTWMGMIPIAAEMLLMLPTSVHAAVTGTSVTGCHTVGVARLGLDSSRYPPASVGQLTSRLELPTGWRFKSGKQSPPDTARL